MSRPEKWFRFKELPPDIRDRLERLPELFANQGVLLAYLFGSLAHIDEGKDVDLALYMEEGLRPYTLQPIINEFLDTDRVDIIDVRRATPVMRFEIISTGKCIFAVDDTIQGTMEVNWVREYKDTAWLRKRHEQFLRERLEKPK